MFLNVNMDSYWIQVGLILDSLYGSQESIKGHEIPLSLMKINHTNHDEEYCYIRQLKKIISSLVARTCPPLWFRVLFWYCDRLRAF